MDTADRRPRSTATEDLALGPCRSSNVTEELQPSIGGRLHLGDEEKGTTRNWASKARHTILIVSIFMTLFLPALDQTIVSTALPKIIASLPAGGYLASAGYTWVGSAYALASAVVMPLFGQLSEVFGRKWVFLSAIVIFMVGSCLCGASQDVAMLIASRSIQGVGAGGILGLVMIIIGDLVGTR